MEVTEKMQHGAAKTRRDALLRASSVAPCLRVAFLRDLRTLRGRSAGLLEPFEHPDVEGRVSV
jgi:hypothetical protein